MIGIRWFLMSIALVLAFFGIVLFAVWWIFKIPLGPGSPIEM